MCGIAGIIKYERTDSFEQLLKRATAQLNHRGPQAPQYWISEVNGIGLGHCRLSIIDTDIRSAQPFTFLDRYQIVHNGELYNYLEVRASLQEKGVHFQTASDTEVIVAAYHVYGSKCLQYFDGMFAFAIWDDLEQVLFCARDRFGEKPFFYYTDDTGFYFASEMKSLWDMGIRKEVNSAMLYNFLTIGYTSNPGNPSETFYGQVYKIPAGSFLYFSKKERETVIQRYWQLYPQTDDAITEDEAIEKFRHLFATSIERRLRSDVKTGISLSGGLDSSSIAAFCKLAGSDQYSHQCFTAVFPGFDKDESTYAKQVAAHCGLQQHEITVQPEEITSLMARVMKHQEEPFGSGSILAQYKVFEAARDAGIHVLLDGQGADETLGGYHKYYRWYWQELYRKKMLSKSREQQYTNTQGLDIPFNLGHKLASLMPQFTAAIQQGRKAKHASQSGSLNRTFAIQHKQQLYYTMPASFDLNGVLYHDTFIQGLEELLRFSDRNSMAHGVEVRLPFLSHEIVSFLFTLPPRFKIKEGWTKWLLRKSAEPLLPASIVWRKGKTGFEPPQQLWMQRADVSEAMYEGKKRLVKNNVLDPAVLQKKIKPHGAHAADTREWRYWSASFLYE